MNCLEFRRLIGADPARTSAEILEHEQSCSACAEFATRMRDLDRNILRALSVTVPESRGAIPKLRAWVRPRRLALAASVLLAVAVTGILWLSFPRETLAEAVGAHMAHEPQAWSDPEHTLTEADLTSVMQRTGVKIGPQIGRVSYAQSCLFRGHLVPHLVVQGEHGPVTVMVLAHESVDAPVRFSEQGFIGVIVPARRGSIAVLTNNDQRVDAVAARALQAVQ